MLTEKELAVLKFRSANLTQIEVASKLGISQAAVSSFENNALRKLEDSKRMIGIIKELRLDLKKK